MYVGCVCITPPPPSLGLTPGGGGGGWGFLRVHHLPPGGKSWNCGQGTEMGPSRWRCITFGVSTELCLQTSFRAQMLGPGGKGVSTRFPRGKGTSGPWGGSGEEGKGRRWGGSGAEASQARPGPRFPAKEKGCIPRPEGAHGCLEQGKRRRCFGGILGGGRGRRAGGGRTKGGEASWIGEAWGTRAPSSRQQPPDFPQGLCSRVPPSPPPHAPPHKL